MTLALAAMDSRGVAVAADSLQVRMTGEGYNTSTVTKTVRSAAWVGVTAGVVATNAGDLNRALHELAGREMSLEESAQALVAAGKFILAPLRPHAAGWFEDGDVVWEFVLLAPGVEGGVPTGVRFRAYMNDGRIAPHIDELRSAAGPGASARLWALGATHPDLRRFSEDYRAAYPDLVIAAEWSRDEKPSSPQSLADTSGESLRRMIENAVATQHLCERPPWWAADALIAAGPVTVETLA